MSLILILLAATVSHVACQRFYIVTSPGQHCPGHSKGEPCITLQQYISGDYNISNLSTPPPTTPPLTQVTLELLPGIHTIQSTQEYSWSVLSTSNISSFDMRGSYATILCIQQTYLYAQQYFRFMNISNISISGINLTNCGGAQFQSVNTLTIANCSIQNHSFVILDHIMKATIVSTLFINGRTLLVQSSSLLLKQTTFSNNTLNGTDFYYSPYGGAVRSNDSNITMKQCSFSNNIAGSGGAVYANNTHVMIIGSSFMDNTATQAGGVVYAHQSSIQVYNSTFYSNSAMGLRITALDCGGGAFHITGTNSSVFIGQSSFFNNTARVMGGALCISGNNTMVSINQGTFIDNTAHQSGGGALDIISNDSFVSINQSYFIHNTAGGGGGAIYHEGHRANILVKRSIFTNNSAAYCAVVDLEGSNYILNFNGSNFIHNTAEGVMSAGGIACINSADISIFNSRFHHNVASGHAGVLHVEGSTLSVQESFFDNNRAGRDGGVMYTKVSPVIILVNYSWFINNTAGEDGGVMYVGSAGSHVRVRESYFVSNNATERGGLIAIAGGELDINETFTYNNMAAYGGVISACSSSVMVQDELIPIEDPTNSSCTLYDEYPSTTNSLETTTTMAPTEASTTTSLPSEASTTHSHMVTSVSTSPLTEVGDTTSLSTQQSSTTSPSADAETTTDTETVTGSTTTSPHTEVRTASPPSDTNTTEGHGHTATSNSTVTNTMETGNQNGVPSAPLESDNYATTVYATLGISILVCVLVLVLYIITTCIVLYLCGVFKSKARKKVDNPYVYVPMNETENSFDHGTSP